MTVRRIPPSTGALEPYMTNALVGRFNAPPAPRIASTAELAIVGTPPMLSEIVPAIGNCFGGFV